MFHISLKEILKRHQKLTFCEIKKKGQKGKYPIDFHAENEFGPLRIYRGENISVAVFLWLCFIDLETMIKINIKQNYSYDFEQHLKKVESLFNQMAV